MELKPYQKQVLNDLESYLEYLQQHKHTGEAFNQFWMDRIGPYNPIDGSGMPHYKNNIPNAVHLSIKVPTAGGKTYIAANALKTIFDAYDSAKDKAVVWLVPWSNILDQTINNLKNPDHPYRKRLNSLFNHKVEVYRKEELLQGANFGPSNVKEQLSIFVMSFASLRARKKEDRKVFQENGQLASFTEVNPNTSHVLQDTDPTALINVIRALNPVLIVDESHNAESDLSVEMLNNLNPSFVLDLTATPKENANIISMVPAIELKKENMVKLPVIAYNHQDKTSVINSALHLQRKLEYLAEQELNEGGKYIRPIVLFQAQPKGKTDNTTFEKLKEKLIKCRIPEEQIKIKTAKVNELKGIDLNSPDCPVRYIITINALKEGWDCPFAYILASLADKSSEVDVEQILGRVLRQPYVRRHKAALLNLSYVITASNKFNATLSNIVEALQSSGFSDKDYRSATIQTELDKENEKLSGVQTLLEVDDKDDITDFNPESIDFDPTVPIDSITNKALDEITISANEEEKRMDDRIEEAKSSDDVEFFAKEMSLKVKSYKVKDIYKEELTKLKLPKFYLDVAQSDIFGTGKQLLSSNDLLFNFKLSQEDTRISFDSIASELYKVDLDKDNAFRPTITQIDDISVKEPIIEYILSRPKEKQVQDVTNSLLSKIGNMFPIPDQEIRVYITRILESMTSEQIRDVLNKEYTYKDAIKKKIKSLARDYGETKFNELIQINKIYTEEVWQFPKSIVPPGGLSKNIANSLYEGEGRMNNFEESVIMSISNYSNILFWHRNLERGKGFSINGFTSNHYPDFIIMTKSDNIICLETKGDYLDNSDSKAKIRLGNKWANLAGRNYHYFMVFENKTLEGAFSLDKAKELIKQL